MKTNSIYRRLLERNPVEKKEDAVANSDSKKSIKGRRGSITPISQEVMDYYQNLLKEHNQFGARHSRAEYRIL
jgi:hypothetical protein